MEINSPGVIDHAQMNVRGRQSGIALARGDASVFAGVGRCRRDRSR